ncbi:MAG: M48 family metallopeptidase [Proteobacteria bacterium]|nr:M48 family metallopeptidase [Pseudomonadota bacterium]
MSSFPLTALCAGIFVVTLLAGTVLRLWLTSRQLAAVTGHRDRVPAEFTDRVSLAEHQKAADYTVATLRFGRKSLVVDVLVTLALTVGGVIGMIDTLWQRSMGPGLLTGALVILSVVLLTGIIDLPFSLWRTFRIEANFGFNRMTAALFLADLAKSCLLGVLIGGPVVLAAMTLMERAGRFWWLYAWVGWMGLMLLMTWAWPAFIAPWFNKFTPLADAELGRRIEALLRRCGFESEGVFVVDGSRRSAHGNAYFTGMGRHKRIVFFDTLLARLSHSEVEAVLAHELGHFKLKHVRKRLLVTMAGSLGALALLGWLTVQTPFYTAFGVAVPSSHAALLLFMFVMPAFGFFATPLGSLWSRRHEFEADAFAANHASAADLATALVKLYRDNATTLTPDPLYSTFYYSHPPATERIAQLRRNEVQINGLTNSLDRPVRA